MTGLLRITWERLLRRVGATGLIGVALLAVAVPLALWTPSLLHQTDALQQAAQARQAARRDNTPREAPTPPSPQAQLQEFSATFPTREHSADDLRQVFAAARRHNVALLKGEYRFVTDPNSPFVTYALTFPVHESYAAIKTFTADVLRALPHAQMDELRLERAEAGAALIDARIRFSLIYRSN